MSFKIMPEISIFKSMKDFLHAVDLNDRDVIVTNESIIAPYREHLTAVGGILPEERYGEGEPTTGMINAMLGAIRGKGYERIIAIGGGGVIDVSKQLLFEDSLSCEDLYERSPNLDRKRKLIAVPTTCGTGSEVSNISVALFKDKGTKIGLVSPSLFPDEAALIPELLESLPYEVFASSSLDALIHAVESFVSPKADVFSKMFSIQSIQRILFGYRKITEDNIPVSELLENFCIASCQAGIAFSNAGCGGVHAMSFPLGGSFHVPHGKANYNIFLAVFGMYARKGARLNELEDVLSQELGSGDVWENLESLLQKVLPRQPLSELGVSESDIDVLVKSVIENQQRLLGNMPIGLSEEDMRQVYMRCM